MIKYYYKQLLVLLTIAIASIQSLGQTFQVTFIDITKDAGIDFRYNFGDFTYENILESRASSLRIHQISYIVTMAMVHLLMYP